jgi:hypothetical protein
MHTHGVVLADLKGDLTRIAGPLTPTHAFVIRCMRILLIDTWSTQSFMGTVERTVSFAGGTPVPIFADAAIEYTICIREVAFTTI